MNRYAMAHLVDWKTSPIRKPLMLRGARQTGKSFLVRQFAREQFAHFMEINFEEHPEVADLFLHHAPKDLLPILEVKFKGAIIPGETLLFLDEIQAAPAVIARLRYFYEKIPELRVVAAGSLLDFVLEDHDFSMPVGRIEYLHLGPMQFEEYLLARGCDQLVAYLGDYHVAEEFPLALHVDLMRHVTDFLVVGGMPEAVRVFSETGSYEAADRIKESIIATFRSDFAKYGKKVNMHRLQKVFSAVPRMVGRKFKYSQVDAEERSLDLSIALVKLEMARVVARIHHASGNGVPLGAESDERTFKALLLDVGLQCRALGLDIAGLAQAREPVLVNSGAVSEQMIGQHLLYSRRFFEEPELYYWVREKEGARAEVDYLFSDGTRIVPVEVKAGTSGTLKSLQLFLREKKLELGVRFNSDRPSLLRQRMHLTDGRRVNFLLLSLPFYLVGQVRRLVRES